MLPAALSFPFLKRDRIAALSGLFALFLYPALDFNAPEAGATPLKLHPGYTLANLRPAGFDPQTAGIDWLSDGRLVLAHWGGLHKKVTERQYGGKVYILTGVMETPPNVTVKEFATGLNDPGGLKVVDDEIYVLGGKLLVHLPDKNKDGKADEVRNVSVWNEPHARHEFIFGLEAKDGFFYGATGVGISGGRSTKPQVNTNRGTWVKINAQTGAREYLAGGLRTPNGIAFGPDDEMFVTDNQGDWLPSSKLMHMQPGKFFGHRNNPPDPKFDPGGKANTAPPVVWFQHGAIGHSPGQPLYMTEGPYQGQFLVGDITYGGIQRVFMEKINGQYQGVLFRHTGGLESGVNRLLHGPNGAIIVGGIGDNDGNWNWTKKEFGLQRLIPNGTPVFEMLAVFSKPQGMTIEFSQPVGTSAGTAANYGVKSWENIPMDGYGAGNKMNIKTLNVANVQVSPDKKRVYLKIDGLETGREVHIEVKGVKSDGGADLWDGDAYYNLTNLGSGDPFVNATTSVQMANGATHPLQFRVAREAGQVGLRVDTHEAFAVTLRDIQGAVRGTYQSSGKGFHALPTQGLKPGIYVVELRAGQKVQRSNLTLF